MATNRERLAARIILRALLPVMKVPLADDPKMKRRFQGVTAKIQFTAKDDGSEMGAYLDFNDGELEIVQGLAENPDIRFYFSSVSKMVAMFGGRFALPKVKGLMKLGLLSKILALFLCLTVLKPNVKPKDPLKKRLKVKMTIYMITTALSQYNKGGDPEMVRWTSKQPERIYQMSVDGEADIAAYLRVKAGKSKAGRGFYTRRLPFLHMRFNGLDGALPILLNEVNMVEAVRDRLLIVEGSPEYGRDIGDFMTRIQDLVM